MQDTSSDSVNSVAIILAFSIAMLSLWGYNKLTVELDNKSEALAKLEQSVQQQQAYLTQCQSEFRGYKEGRR